MSAKNRHAKHRPAPIALHTQSRAPQTAAPGAELRQRHVLTLEITLQAPYLVHGNDAGRYGLHATLLTDHRDRPVLPGTLLAGRIAEVWTAHGVELGGADADQWFGRPGLDPDSDSAQRARLRVADLVLQSVDGTAYDPSLPRHDLDASRIRLDDDTGSVEHGALLMVEQISRPGAPLVFSGEWSTWATPAEVRTLRTQLQAALLLQTQLGAWRNVGFGRVLSVDVRASLAYTSLAPTAAPPAASRSVHDTRQRYQLTTTDALCLATRSRRGNVFESQDHFTGGTLLGALAQTLMSLHGAPRVSALAEHSTLARHFDKLRCTHALPTAMPGVWKTESGEKPVELSASRPLPLPQSLVYRSGDGDEALPLDAWKHGDPPAGVDATFAFQTDWKGSDKQAAAQLQDWGRTTTHLRVRTDIDADGQAKTGQLFAYECCCAPLDAQGQPETRWLFDLDLSAIPEDQDRAAVWAELAALLAHPLAPLGKTDAQAQVTPLPVNDPGLRPTWPDADLAQLKAGDKLPLLLVTDALLFPVTAVADQPEVDLVALYRDAFDVLQKDLQHPGVLRYRHHFATQRLAGGAWLHGRHGAARRRPAYQPLVLTEAGSVFVFEVGPDAQAARSVLQHWQTHGLALPPAVVQVHGDHWSDHPYLPQNGHGEVAVQPAHDFPVL